MNDSYIVNVGQYDGETALYIDQTVPKRRFFVNNVDLK